MARLRAARISQAEESWYRTPFAAPWNRGLIAASPTSSARSRRPNAARSFPVGYPDVLYLIGMFQEPSSLALAGAQEVDLTSFVGPYLLQIPGGQ